MSNETNIIHCGSDIDYKVNFLYIICLINLVVAILQCCSGETTNKDIFEGLQVLEQRAKLLSKDVKKLHEAVIEKNEIV